MASNQGFKVVSYSAKSNSRGECIINVKKKLRFLALQLPQTIAVSFALNML